MDVTITYKMSQQISPDDWDCWTEVINVDENATMKDVFLRLEKTNNFKGGATVELHFNREDRRVVPAKVVEQMAKEGGAA